MKKCYVGWWFGGFQVCEAVDNTSWTVAVAARWIKKHGKIDDVWNKYKWHFARWQRLKVALVLCFPSGEDEDEKRAQLIVASNVSAKWKLFADIKNCAPDGNNLQQMTFAFLICQPVSQQVVLLGFCGKFWHFHSLHYLQECIDIF